MKLLSKLFDRTETEKTKETFKDANTDEWTRLNEENKRLRETVYADLLKGL